MLEVFSVLEMLIFLVPSCSSILIERVVISTDFALAFLCHQGITFCCSWGVVLVCNIVLNLCGYILCLQFGRDSIEPSNNSLEAAILICFLVSLPHSTIWICNSYPFLSILPNEFLLLLPLYVLVAVADTIINLRYQNYCLSLGECIICQDLAPVSYSNFCIYSNSMILGYCSMTRKWKGRVYVLDKRELVFA